MLQHFRGNLGNWDPALTDALAGDTALGSKRDSAMICAAISAAETFQRAAARRIGSR